jgi:hypothetical protein
VWCADAHTFLKNNNQKGDIMTTTCFEKSSVLLPHGNISDSGIALEDEPWKVFPEKIDRLVFVLYTETEPVRGTVVEAVENGQSLATWSKRSQCWSEFWKAVFADLRYNGVCFVDEIVLSVDKKDSASHVRSYAFLEAAAIAFPENKLIRFLSDK